MIFERLRLVDEPIPGDGAWNMAVDEALLATIETPILRIYLWSEPTVSFGYFEKLADIQKLRPGVPLVRRWTGGGMVDHGDDRTYSLLIPTSHPLAQSERRESYRIIHEILQNVIASKCQITLELASEKTSLGAGCFQQPVIGDLLLAGRKIAGAAQRRTRHGLLHQGSIQKIPLAQIPALDFAHAFGSEPSSISLTEVERQNALELASKRYGTPEWLARF